ncbi:MULTISPECIES: TIR domain-containing protein [Aminobacterium]|jgi:hypothetical protein|uniref:TIR domain-containing protein n=1 Tax=Aminobacterium TaxID=81466 RepID=UPI002580DC4D|nr:TIR domain-containing protein [Aminobacterium sp. UBA4987]
MPTLRQYNIFISHAWDYDQHYDRLVSLLKEARYFKMLNYSAPRDKPLAPPNCNISEYELARRIKEKITHAHVVIVIAGMWVDYSKWIHYEIDTAATMRRPILCVKPWGHKCVPKDVEFYANKVVNWDTSSIVNAIRELA